MLSSLFLKAIRILSFIPYIIIFVASLVFFIISMSGCTKRESPEKAGQHFNHVIENEWFKCQYTGQKHKNGTEELFDGDILKTFHFPAFTWNIINVKC